MRGKYFFVDNSLEPYRKEIWQIESILFSGKSEFQKIDVVKLDKLGKTLFLDEAIQFSEFDEAHYHELFVHPASAVIKPERVLVLGGGDGGCVRELLKHESVKEVIVCEIDPMVVDVSKEYFPQMANSFNDKRVILEFQDAKKFIESDNSMYDLVLVDLTDLGELSSAIYNVSFYSLLQSRLSPKGGTVIQTSGVYFFDDDAFSVYSFIKDLKKFFKFISLSYVPVFSYPGAENSFLYCSNEYDFSNLRLPPLSFESTLRFYTTQYAESTFKLNSWIQKKLNKANL